MVSNKLSVNLLVAPMFKNVADKADFRLLTDIQ